MSQNMITDLLNIL